MEVKFIDTDYLKRNTNIEQNIDDDKLVPYIYRAQDIYLQEKLGSSFMNDLQKKIINDTLSQDEIDLIDDYIQPMVCEWTQYLAIPNLNFKLTNKAMSKENSEWSQSSSLNEIKYIRSTVRDMAEFYSKRLVKYLSDHCDLFEKYSNPDYPENVNKNNTSYFSGIYIKNRNRR